MLLNGNSPLTSRFFKMFVVLVGALLLIMFALHSLAPVQTAVGAVDAAGLQIKKIGPSTAFAGDTITYTILVTNATDSTLNGVIITDTWNTQIFTGPISFGGGVTVLISRWITTPVRYAEFDLAPLAPNAIGRITMTMLITPVLQPRFQSPVVGPTLFGNSVVITTSNAGVTAGTDSVHSQVVGPLLVLTKVYTPTNPRIGRLLTYTLKLENKFRGDSIDATNVVITERLPLNTIFYSAVPAEIATYYPVTNMVQWNLTQTVPVSGVVYLTFTMQIAPNAPYGNITNPTTGCAARADGLPLSVFCSTNVNVQDNDIFEKVGQTVSPPSQIGTISRTFPNRIMTYTVYVYNPYSTTISGLIVTDTLPTYNNLLGQTFVYSDVLVSSPPALPAVISQSPTIVAWQLPAIAGWGVYTFTFRVMVPPQMRIDDNQVQRLYQNILSGSYGGLVLTTNDGGHDDSMKVLVVPQIQIIKTVVPTQQIFGQPVTYTLVVSNSGPTTIHDVQLSDVLPCSFVWNGLVSGQPPLNISGNLVSWSGITLTAYAQTTLAVFRATAFAVPNNNCYNTVQGYSPDTYIVRRTNLAPVYVLPPFGYNKTVAPSSVILGGSIQYTVHAFNLSTVNATMTNFTDVLPQGFYFNGSPTYSDNTTLVLQANHANEYQTSFPVNVVATPVACDNLPSTVYQAVGKLQLRISDPVDLANVWTNASSAAGVLVRPQAQLFKTAAPSAVLPGDVVTFTLMLSNNTNSLISSIRLTDTLPGGFVFGGELPGTPPHFAISGTNVIWDGLSLSGGSIGTFAFTAIASMVPNNYSNQAKASSLTNPLICIPKASAPIAVKAGIVTVNKSASPISVGPLGQFVYNISLNNTGPYTVTMSRFTETLPGVTGYPWKYISMQSGDPLPIQTNPIVWTNLSIGAGRTRSLHFTVRTETQVGTYPNLTSPSPLAGFMTGTVPAPWKIIPVNPYNNSPVTVIPGVGVAKDVDPDHVNFGGIVTYTITIANVSGQTVNNVRITDTLPAGFTWDSYVSGAVPLSVNPLIVWSLGSMANGSTQQLVFRVHVANNQASGKYYNRVAATADSISIAPTGPVAPVVVAGLPSLIFSKSADPSAVAAGHEVTYTLDLFNPDLVMPVTATMTDTLPNGFSYVGMISGTAPVTTSPQMIWTNFQVAPNSSQRLIYKVLVAASTPDGTYYNQLDGSSAQTVFPVSGPMAPVLVVHSPSFDVQISKTDDAYTNTLGGTRVYTLYYTNTLNTLGLLARNVIVTDTFSPADYLMADAPGWNLAAAGVYTQAVGDLPAGASGWLTLGLTVDPGIPANYLAVTNTAQIGADAPADVPEATEQPATNNTSNDVDIIRGADIAVLGLTYSPSNLQLGKLMTVVVKLQNRGVDATAGPDLAGWFYTDLYVKPIGAPAPAGPADRYLGFCLDTANFPCTQQPDHTQFVKTYTTTAGAGGLAPGETVNVTYTLLLNSTGAQWLYVQADPFWAQNGDPDPVTYGSSQDGRVVEGNEDNNIFGPFAIDVKAYIYLPIVLRNR